MKPAVLTQLRSLLSCAGLPCLGRPTLSIAGAVVLACGCVLAVPARYSMAQDGGISDVEVYENRPIEIVLVRGSMTSEGVRTQLSPEARQQAVNVITSKTGSIFDAQRVRDDIRQLNRLGLFQRVEIYAGLTDEGTVELAFDLLERMQVIDVQVTGNTEISDNEVRSVIDVIPGTPIDRFQIDRSARRVEELYRNKGYYFVRVNIDEEELADTGLVIFRVLEGNRLKVTAIRFSGNEAFENKKLRREIKTKKSWS